MTMPAQPQPAAPPTSGAPGTITLPPTGAFDPQTGEPVTPQQPPPAVDPRGVWGSDVQPATPPASAATVAPPTQVPAPATTPIQPVVIDGRTYFTADDIEKARREERDKLYGRMEEMGQQVSSVTEYIEQERQRREAAEREVAEAAERARQAGLSVDERVGELEQRMAAERQQWQEEIARRDALFEQERKFQELTAYKDRRVSEESDAIHPTFVEYITGSTPEEIEASIAAAKAKTDAIVQDVQGQPVIPPAQVRSVAPTGVPPVDPVAATTSGQQTLTAQDIAQMGPAEYAKHRTSLMQAVNERWRSGGLYQP